MLRRIDPEKVTVACKVCGEMFHSVETLRTHQHNFWTRISHLSLFGVRNELQTHKLLYQAGREVPCIVCEAHYDEYMPNAAQASNTYMIDEHEN